jgi:diguanylate cyclase (GGDEF)-like protein/PAS domain S-box-containing protein
MWTSLIANFAIVGLFVSGWLQAQEVLGRFRRHHRRLLFGIAMGCGALVSMMLSIPLSEGVIFDLRSTFIAISAFIGGPLAAVITAAIVSAYRLSIGGPGAAGAILSVLVVTAVGLAGNRLIGKRTPGWVASVAFAAVSATAPMTGVLLLPSPMREQAFATMVGPVVGFGFIATFLAVSSIARTRRLVEERKLLRAALQQAPDYLYVKDRESRFVAANNAVAQINGLNAPEDLKGLTDFDLVEHDRALSVFQAEQELMQSEAPILNLEEHLATDSGPRWYLTSKSPVHNIDGEVLGLAGTTRDITERKSLEHQLAESRKELGDVLTEMSDGIARFDAAGVLRFCNEQYRGLFPLTSELRIPGTPLREILSASVARKEQLDVPSDRVEAWMNDVLRSLTEGGDSEARLFDGRWLHIRTKPMADGGAIVVVSDITVIKQAEAGLLALTQQLRALADTDGLTGLCNRRRFDEMLENELRRTGRSHSPLSLLMLDIDRFKAFNDTYGHQAGDECIQKVAGVLQRGTKRPADVVARYGGEELCVVLPDTSEDGALALAQQLRQAVRDLSIPHAGSEMGMVTVSMGVATAIGSEPLSPAELIKRADLAMYSSKSAGRDRVMGWQSSLESRVA